MFQTEIILFLQSFSSGFLDEFFKTLTEIGRPEYSVPLLVVLIFGCHFRFGFALVHVAAWSGLITMGLKEIFSLPRPLYVDLNVKALGESYANSSRFVSMGADSFFGCLPEQVVEYYRSHPPYSWGFPSGHTSHALTTWGALYLFFKHAWVRILAGGMIFLIPLSRIYLGRHFLADVLGGYAIGFVFVLIFYYSVLKQQRLSTPVFSLRKVMLDFNLKIFLIFIYFLGIPWVILLVPSVKPQFAGAFLGLNIGFLLVWMRGIPEDRGTILQRTARVVLAAATFTLLYLGLKATAGLLFSLEPGVVAFFRYIFTLFFVIWGTTEICIKIGLYQRKT